jgi:hypothetical protein
VKFGLRVLTGLICLAACTAPAQTNIVKFDLGNFTAQHLSGRKVTITPLDAPYNSGGKIVARDKRTFTTDTNGIFYTTNTVAMDYMCEILAPPASTPFYIAVTNSGTNVMDAYGLRIPTANSSVDELGYTRAQVDDKISGATNANSSAWQAAIDEEAAARAAADSAEAAARAAADNLKADTNSPTFHTSTTLKDAAGNDVIFTRYGPVWRWQTSEGVYMDLNTSTDTLSVNGVTLANTDDLAAGDAAVSAAAAAAVADEAVARAAGDARVLYTGYTPVYFNNWTNNNVTNMPALIVDGNYAGLDGVYTNCGYTTITNLFAQAKLGHRLVFRQMNGTNVCGWNMQFPEQAVGGYWSFSIARTELSNSWNDALYSSTDPWNGAAGTHGDPTFYWGGVGLFRRPGGPGNIPTVRWATTNAYLLNGVSLLADDADHRGRTNNGPDAVSHILTNYPAFDGQAYKNKSFAGQQWAAMNRPYIWFYGLANNILNQGETNIIAAVRDMITNGYRAIWQSQNVPLAMHIDVTWAMARDTTWAYTVTNWGSLKWNTNQFPSGIPYLLNYLNTNSIDPWLGIYTGTNQLTAGASEMCCTIGGIDVRAYTNGTGTRPLDAGQGNSPYTTIVTPESIHGDLTLMQFWGARGIVMNGLAPTPGAIAQYLAAANNGVQTIRKPIGYNQNPPYNVLNTTNANMVYSSDNQFVELPYAYAYSNLFAITTIENLVGVESASFGFAARYRNQLYNDNLSNESGVRALRFSHRYTWPYCDRMDQGGFTVHGWCDTAAEFAAAFISSSSILFQTDTNVLGGHPYWKTNLVYLTNSMANAVWQDAALSIPRLRDYGTNYGSVWVKDLADGSRAVAIFNEGATSTNMTVHWSDLRLNNNTPCMVTNVWTGGLIGMPSGAFTTNLASGSHCLLKFTPYVSSLAEERTTYYSVEMAHIKADMFGSASGGSGSVLSIGEGARTGAIGPGTGAATNVTYYTYAPPSHIAAPPLGSPTRDGVYFSSNLVASATFTANSSLPASATTSVLRFWYGGTTSGNYGLMTQGSSVGVEIRFPGSSQATVWPFVVSAGSKSYSAASIYTLSNNDFTYHDRIDLVCRGGAYFVNINGVSYPTGLTLPVDTTASPSMGVSAVSFDSSWSGWVVLRLSKLVVW